MEKLVSPEGVVQWLPYGAPNYNAIWNTSDDINGNTVVYVPCQLYGHDVIWSGGSEVFDLERVAVDLWNYALGTTTQSFTFTPGAGLVQQFNTSYTTFSNYLNLTPNPQGGLIYADAGDPPTLALTAPPLSPDAGWGWGVAMALNGPPGGQAWLQRCAVESTMTYNPAYLGQVYQDPNTPPYSTFGQYVSSNYTGPTNLQSLTTATTDCDVTGRTAVMRQGAEEGGQSSSQFLAGVGVMLDANEPLPTPLPDATTILDANGDSIQSLWTPK